MPRPHLAKLTLRACFALALPVILLASRACAAPSQPSDDYIVQVWDSDSGLPQSTVTSIAQTPDGYLWIGTMYGGLARFNGNHFVNFQPGNTPDIKSIEIHNLFVDAQGTLWIHTVEGGLVSYRDWKFHFEYSNPQTPAAWLKDILSDKPGKLQFYSRSGMIFSRTTGSVGGKDNVVDQGQPHSESERRLAAGLEPSNNPDETFYPTTTGSASNHWEVFVPPTGMEMDTLCEDCNGVIWGRMDNGILAQIRGTNIVSLPKPPGLRSPHINVLVKDHAGRIWVATPGGMACWDGKAFVDMTPTNGATGSTINQLFPCPDGSFWVLTDDHLSKCFGRNWITEAKLYDDQADKDTRKKFLAGLSSLFVDSAGGIWIAHLQNGVGHVQQDGRVSWVSEPQHLVTGTVHCWYEDREGNIWIGLFDGGLARIRQRVFHSVWPADGADSKTACSVCEGENGMMWFGTQGQQILGWDHGAFTTILQAPQPNKVMKVLTGDQGKLWVGSIHGGVLELTNNKFTRPFPAEDINTVVRCFYRDRRGVLWIGSEFGLFAWNKNHLKSFSIKDGFSPAYVLAFAEDKTGGIWLGTGLGELRCFQNGKFQTFLPRDTLTDTAAMTAEAIADSQNRGVLSGGQRFWSLHFDDDNVLWIGTLGGGLLRFEDGTFTRFTKADGLPSDDVSQILEDSHGQLWLGTSVGIVRVIKRELDDFAEGHRTSPNFVAYDKFDGLPALECSGGTQPNCWRSQDGRLWFTTVKGAVWVDPEDLTLNRVAPHTHIEEFLLDGKSLVEKGFAASQMATRPPGKISVAAGQHFYEFKFSALSLASPNKVKFKWRLAGLDHEWVNGGSHDSANYSFIPPGTYQFEVLGCNNDGLWSYTPAIMELTVLPYFWQRWWFKLAIGLCIIAGLITIYVVKISRIRMLERLRLRIARDLHDEVGANLGSIALLAQIMEKSPSSTDAAQVSSIAAQTIETLRDIIWFIDPTHNNLSDLVLRLQETSRIMLAAIPHKFEQHGDFRSMVLPLSFRRNVPAIFKETLHNIVRHSNATEVTIAVSRVEKKFQFRVQDNGVGFHLERKSVGNGLKNMRRRAGEINAQLSIESAPGRGTITTFSVAIT